jgi:hypothetical protein
MAGLANDMQRRFVEHYVVSGGANATASAQAAGYSVTNKRAAAVSGNKLLKDEKVLLAIREVAGGLVNADLPKLRKALLDIALNPEHKDCAKVLMWLHACAGISPITKTELKQETVVTVKFDRAAAIAELKRLERDMGVNLLPTPVAAR